MSDKEIIWQNIKDRVIVIYENWNTNEQKEHSADLIDHLREEEIALLDDLIIPPSAAKVCKALEAYFKQGTVTYKGTTFYKNMQQGVRAIFSINSKGNLIQHHYDLPPELIVLIGRFYENLKKEV